MTRFLQPFRHRHSRRLLTAWTLSALGTGIGHIALMLVAYRQFGSAWAVSAVLLAEFLPAMFLGAHLGSLADRWSRRGCAVIGEVLGAVAFAGMVFADSLPVFALMSLLAGLGGALFFPAVLAGLPSLVPDDDVPATTAMFSTIEELGFVAGPAIGAILFALTGTDAALALNAVTFAVSAAVLATLPFGRPPGGDAEEDAPAPGVLTSLRSIGDLAYARTVVLAGFPIALFFGLFTTVEVMFATDVLHLSAASFSLLAAILSVGMTLGALFGPGGKDPRRFRNTYVVGLALMGGGLILTAGATSLGMVAVVFILLGWGNGAVAVQERLVLQHEVPERLQGCAFGAKRAMSSWGMGLSYVSGAVLATAIGLRPTLLVAGIGLAALTAWVGPRLLERRPPAPAPATA